MSGFWNYCDIYLHHLNWEYKKFVLSFYCITRYHLFFMLLLTNFFHFLSVLFHIFIQISYLLLLTCILVRKNFHPCPCLSVCEHLSIIPSSASFAYFFREDVFAEHSKWNFGMYVCMGFMSLISAMVMCAWSQQYTVSVSA